MNLTLKDTAKLMEGNKNEKLIAEYMQTKIRYDKLHEICVKLEAGTLNFKPITSMEHMKEQKMYMGNYLRMLEIRAELEGVELPKCVYDWNPLPF